jgi:hypothetical protein
MEGFWDLLGVKGIGIRAGIFVSRGGFAFGWGGPAAKHEA